jgi:hypothetical protein
MEPSTSAEVWRLEMHDPSGRTVHIQQDNPDADCVMPRECPHCGLESVTLSAAGRDVEGTCSECGHRWLTGHLNDTLRDER